MIVGQHSCACGVSKDGDNETEGKTCMWMMRDQKETRDAQVKRSARQWQESFENKEGRH